MINLSHPLVDFEYEKEDILNFFNASYAPALLRFKDFANHIGSFNVKQEFLEQSFPKLCNSIRNVINSNDIFFARFFITLPNSKGDIHIDTQKGLPDVYRNLTLNVPLTDCRSTFHEWYNTKNDPYTEFKYSALYWRNYENGELIDRYELLVPTILKVSVPHRIYNPLDSFRVILSIRTESDTFKI